MNFGIIGYGLSARVFHIPLISSTKDGKVYSILTRNQDSIESIKKMNSNIHIYSEIDSMLNDKKIDTIVICVPNEFHFEFAKKALEKGKNVIVEKPFTVNYKEANELVVLAKSVNKTLSIYHNRRFDSDFLTIQEILHKGLLGRLVQFEATYYRYRKEIKENSWREESKPGSGYLFDLGSHLIDQALTLFGLPEEIYCDMSIQRTGGLTDDQFELHMYYEGFKAIIKSGNLVNATLPRYILLGEEGSFVKYGIDVQEDDLKKGLTPKDKFNWGEEGTEDYGYLKTNDKIIRYKGLPGNYLKYYDNFIKSCEDGIDPYVKSIDGANVIYIIEKAIESNNIKGRVKI
jgi:predicted dehydrogenase